MINTITSSPYFFPALVIYILGCPVMYFYSLYRDKECDLDRNPWEALFFALIWPVLVVCMAVIIPLEEIVYRARKFKKRK
ncbi:hypothetical protein QMM96_22125 [Citrobacter freundii]|uniref:hypothetical protein n=1 Tax=Citrobacter freundii TaxID=546 RepID=UPI002B244D16|nr:hypothetical protein [Citrobacter freundii]MEB2478129.1 hypothetical protein [Citrobacter freundii]